MRGMTAAHFAAEMDAIATWVPLHRNAVRTIRDINSQARIGLALAVEAITAKPHGDPVLDELRAVLVPLSYSPPVDKYATDPAPWPEKPHCMCVDFEHRPSEVIEAVKGWLERWIRPLELNFVFYDTLLRRRYWGAATNIPPVPPGDIYMQVWNEIVKFTQARIAPVWAHNSGVTSDAHPGPHECRIEEHFYRLSPNERALHQAAAIGRGYELVRAGEWVDIAGEQDRIRTELASSAAAGDAWVVSARSGSAFGVWS